MHIHNKRISQLHAISRNQCSARIKQLALSETYNTSPFLYFVSEIVLNRTTLHKGTSSSDTVDLAVELRGLSNILAFQQHILFPIMA